MSKNGYDQFFKQARKAAAGQTPQPKKSFSELKTSLKKKKKSSPFPIGAFLSCLIGLGGAFYFFENQDYLLKVLSAVEITLFPEASAESSQVPQTPQTSITNPTPPVMAEPTGDELNHLMKLVERKKELDSREEELNRVEAALGEQKAELQKRLNELEKMRGSISNLLENRVKADEQKLDTLVQFYSNMKPPQAAKIFETIDEDLAVQIIGRMKKKNAADILNLMKPEKAQMFTESFAGYKRKTASTPTEASEKDALESDDASMAQQKP